MIRLRPFRRPTRPAVPPTAVAAGGARAGAASSQAGFTLVELAVVSSVIGIVLAGSLAFMNSYTDGQRRLQVNTQLDTIEEALVLYTAQHRRLPCPAAPGGTGAEDGDGSGCGSQEQGVVPWRTLGLSEDQVIDPWAHYFTYRVDDDKDDGDHTSCAVISPARDEGMNFASCQPGNANFPTRLEDIGLRVGNDPGNAGELVLDPENGTAPSGAAYVLISHGENGFGAPTRGGTEAIDITGATGGETRNDGDNDVYSPTGGASYYDGTGGDDIVRHMTIMRLAQKAGLGPKAP